MMWPHWHEGIGACSGCHPGTIFALVLLVVIFGLAIWGIVALARRSSKHKGAMAIARERYARGEINKEEFDQIKKDLR